MQTNVVTVSDKWQVVIPKAVRSKLNIKPKDKVLVSSLDSKKFVVDVVGEDVVRKAYGFLKKYDTDRKMFQRLLRQKREDLKYEDRKIRRVRI